ncbi:MULTISPECIES: hypothetical protein [unclassified Streptomyces]|uniref:Uncharacterized protein n=1 Tax=Streptomyces sp. NBC_00060 TaxID=2975636 RepID=A0AAU2GQR2_9ACTN
MKPAELDELLTAPAEPPMRDALRRLSPRALDALIVEALFAAEEGWRQVVVDRVMALAAQQPDQGRPVIAAYITATEQRTPEGMCVGWSPRIAAFASTDEAPDLTHSTTTVTFVPAGGESLAEEADADAELAEALRRLAALDPPGHEDVLHVYLPARLVTHLKP